MFTALAAVTALTLDAWWGEPRRLHPLVLFGDWAGRIERWLHADRRVSGVIAWSVAVLPPVMFVGWLTWATMRVSPWLAFALSALVLYVAVGHRSLGEHARPVAQALRDGDLDAARAAVGRMVSRDTAALSATQVAAAATESVLENGSDAVFAALFWFALLGVPGVVLYRLANTLDAMWGYRTVRYDNFGWAAARIDDVLNLLPARLAALTYVALGDSRIAWRSWHKQGVDWKSPNAGPVMAAGAGALRVQLGGAAPYHGQLVQRPALGEGDAANADSIARALRLVRNGVLLWLSVGVLIALAVQWMQHA